MQRGENDVIRDGAKPVSYTHLDVYKRQPYASTRYGNNDEIRIPIQQQDIFTLPAESFLYIEDEVKRVA